MNMDETRYNSYKPSAHGQSGQSLILALMVMFLLVFISGVFISLIARNIGRTARSAETLSAEYLADAGIRYASDQLSYSQDGADWRPVPTDSAGANDPDDFWLSEPQPDRKWSRFTYGKGRFLIRVTYDPKPNDPMSRYIKIESIGRVGLVDVNDPTTLTNQQPMHLRKEKVAYKAVAITDYGRFVMNNDRRTDEFALGTPGFVTTFGEQADVDGNGTVDPSEGAGGSIRVNGNLMWHGKNYVWLSSNRGEAVEVAGDIRFDVRPDPANPDPRATYVYVNNAPAEESSAVDVRGITLFDSSPDNSAADIGRYRDGRTTADRGGRPRSVPRIDPPLIDVSGPGGGLSRYRELTRNSGEWRSDSGGEWFNTGYYGWGEGIYIDNRDDVQAESELYTLRGNWTQPGGPYWIGPYYTPPGVSILLTPYDLDNKDGDNDVNTGPDMVLTHDSAPDLPRFNWYDENGNLLTSTGERLIMPYPKNGVIFAEGNIRIKGTLPAPSPLSPDDPDYYSNKLTVVSGATIYVEGSILKNPTSPEESAIALLATDYVCVNTTQFFAPVREVLMSASSNTYFDVSPERTFWFDFASGKAGTEYLDTDGAQVPISLYVRHTSDADAGVSYMNMLVNYGSAANPLFNNFPGVTYAVGGRAAQKYPRWEHAVFDLFPVVLPSEYEFYPEPGVYNKIGFQLDQSISAPLGLQDYYLSRAAVQPCDIRIEALLYAQNRSFFVIPGEWFNPDPTDTWASYFQNGDQRPEGIDMRWPFYGQPLDVQITVFGAVSENISASIGDSSAWMAKWGWIPDRHGSVSDTDIQDLTVAYREPLDPDPASGDTRRRGLTFIYDGQLSCPKMKDANGAFTGTALRVDAYGRTLPIVPKLPVSAGPLYSGKPI